MASDNPNFQVFISFKNTDENGSPTEDCRMAHELLDALTESGVETFMSDVSINRLGESDYRKAIDEALDSAKVLVVVAASAANMQAPWVRKEWMSFDNDILSGIKPDGKILSYTRGVKVQDIPRALRVYQMYPAESNTPSMVAAAVVRALGGGQAGTAATGPGTQAASTGAGAAPGGIRSRVSGPHGHRSSNYSSTYGNELERLMIQAENDIDADSAAIAYVKEQLGDPVDMVVDVGSAYGFVARSRFGDDDFFKQVLCIDINEDVIQKAIELNDNPKIHFAVMDVEAPDFDDQLKAEMAKYGVQAADVVYSALTIHHLADPLKALRKLKKTMRRGGRIILRGSDDGSKLDYPDRDGLMDQIIKNTMATPGVSDRINGRKIYSQLVDSGFDDVHMFISTRDLSNCDFDQRELVYTESFSWRTNYAKRLWEKNPDDPEARERYEWMKMALSEFEDVFFGRDFWYAESDYVGVGRR
jgi:SAM-dependent methyltransferase